MFELPLIPQEHEIKHRIELLLGSTPPSKWPYRISPSDLVEVLQQLDKYLSKGWVHPSTSVYGAPLLFV